MHGSMVCATPGADPKDSGATPSGRYSTYENLFYRASKCKDHLNICHSEVQSAQGGLHNSNYGFKHVAEGSHDDIVVPENYFCLADYS